MTKLHKKLLTISLISVSLISCALLKKNAPDFPLINQYGPIWGSADGVSLVKRWHFTNNKDDTRASVTNDQAREAIMLCTDAASKTRVDDYIKELESIIKNNCNK